jgi:hypothetical protein
VAPPPQPAKRPEPDQHNNAVVLNSSSNNSEKEEESTANSFLVISVSGSASTESSWSSHDTSSSSGSYSVPASELAAEKQRWASEVQKTLANKNQEAPEVQKTLANKNQEAPEVQKTLANKNQEALEVQKTLANKNQEAPEVQKTLANKNQEALEAIRRSLSNKLINLVPPSRVVESMRSCGSLDLLQLPERRDTKLPAPAAPHEEAAAGSSCNESMGSSRFEEARASLQDLLQLGRPPAAGTKRQAPLPPPEPVPEVGSVQPKMEDGEGKTVESTPVESSSLQTQEPQTPKLTPAIR